MKDIREIWKEINGPGPLCSICGCGGHSLDSKCPAVKVIDFKDGIIRVEFHEPRKYESAIFD